VSKQKLKNRREFSAQQKAQIAIELIRGDKTLSQMSAEHQIKESVLSRWKQEFLERAPQLFLRAGNSEQEIKMLEMESKLEQQAQDMAILKKALLLSDELKEKNS
jgi:putative transposase